MLALTAVNVLRVTTLYFVLASHAQLFETLHVEVWPLLLVLCAGGLFWIAAYRLDSVTVMLAPEGPMVGTRKPRQHRHRRRTK